MRRPIRRAGRSGVLAAVLALCVLAAGCGGPTPPPIGCWSGTAGQEPVALDLEQARNAATIAAVGRRMGLPDHAVTIALAAALQESKLHNLQYGDLDSLGLFQQRPSQGWGTPAEILQPRLATAAFYRRLILIPDWQVLPVTVAAQAVQRSGLPSAYARWESDARLLARALTGEIPAGIWCTTGPLAGPPDLAGAATQAAAEMGPGSLAATSIPGGWAAATWLVANAADLRLRLVALRGLKWTAATGRWQPDPGAGSAVRYG